jgi:hypothetical protein
MMIFKAVLPLVLQAEKAEQRMLVGELQTVQRPGQGEENLQSILTGGAYKVAASMSTE